MRKNSVIWAFCATFIKKCEKIVFFHVFRDTFLFKVRKKWEKTVFFKLFAQSSAKSVIKQCFFHVFWAFCSTFLKKCEKTVFFHVFRDTLYKVRKKCEKTALFELFARRSSKSVRKQCFFPFFETLCFAKSVRKQCFSHFFRFLRDVHQKVWENSVFSRFSRHFVQSSQKTQKNSFLELLALSSAKSVRKQCFFSSFLSFLCDVRQKVWENCFSRFSRHFVQSSQKMRKNSIIWAFCATFIKKCEKSVFSRFSWHVFVQSSQKMRKNSVF